jgi:hypothetical protein
MSEQKLPTARKVVARVRAAHLPSGHVTSIESVIPGPATEIGTETPLLSIGEKIAADRIIGLFF